MARWGRWNSVNLKSHRYVDCSLDQIVEHMNIPRDVGRPPWNRRPRSRYSSWRRGFDSAPRVKRLQNDYSRRPRDWKRWNRRRDSNRAPRYSNWYNRRRNRDDDDWVDEEEDVDAGSTGSYSGDRWRRNRPTRCYMDLDQSQYRTNYRRRDDYRDYNYNRAQNYYRNYNRRFEKNFYNDYDGYHNNRFNNNYFDEQYDRNDRYVENDDDNYNNRSSFGRDESLRKSPSSTREETPTKKSTANSKPLRWPTLLISNLHPNVNDLDIYDLFKEFGNLKRANVHHDKTGISLQTADVVFFSEEDARVALREYDGTLLDGCRMRIFLCNSFVAAKPTKTGSDSQTNVNNNRGQDEDLSKSSSRESQRSSRSQFRVNDIPRVEHNRSFHRNFAEELKEYKSSKPRIPLKQGKWWRQHQFGRGY